MIRTFRKWHLSSHIWFVCLTMLLVLIPVLCFNCHSPYLLQAHHQCTDWATIDMSLWDVVFVDSITFATEAGSWINITSLIHEMIDEPTANACSATPCSMPHKQARACNARALCKNALWLWVDFGCTADAFCAHVVSPCMAADLDMAKPCNDADQPTYWPDGKMTRNEKRQLGNRVGQCTVDLADQD